MEEKTDIKKTQIEKENSEGLALNLMVQIIWFILGLAYVSYCLINKSSPFSQFAPLQGDEITSGTDFIKFAFLGNVLPIVLFVFSAIGVINIFNTPYVCFNKVNRFNLAIVPALGVIIGVVLLFVDEALDYLTDPIMLSIMRTFIPHIIWMIIFIAPLFANAIFEKLDLNEAKKKASLMLGFGFAIATLIGVVDLIGAAIEYAVQVTDGLAGVGIILVIFAIAVLIMPTTTYIIIIIRIKD